MSADARKDLDETRRLLYMVKACHRTERHNLVGTLTNALAHHEGNVGADADAAMDHLIAAIQGDSDALDWVAARIGDTSEALAALPAEDDEP